MDYRSKSDLVAEEIKTLIRAGELSPGATLRQRDLAARFDVSPTPVREALRRLEAEGYITSRLHRGATVVRHESSRLEENFRIRAVLEPLAAQMAAERATADDLADIAALHEAIAGCPPGDPAIDDLNRRFHFRIYDCARSPVLAALLNLLWRALDGGPHVWRPHRDSVKQHGEILNALRDRAGERAADLTRHHILEVLEILSSDEATR
jgi:DNA-binding GntR family transcriptional regulator